LLAGLDTDHDGTVSVDEAKKAAEVMFDKLDRDHDGTLTGREFSGRLTAREFAAADADKDGTLNKDEYLAVVEQRFKAADIDNDGTLTRQELKTKAGRQLLRLVALHDGVRHLVPLGHDQRRFALLVHAAEPARVKNR
jgi:Ca2+-binding EF-hand superfamily protein